MKGVEKNRIYSVTGKINTIEKLVMVIGFRWFKWYLTKFKLIP